MAYVAIADVYAHFVLCVCAYLGVVVTKIHPQPPSTPPPPPPHKGKTGWGSVAPGAFFFFFFFFFEGGGGGQQVADCALGSDACH